MSASTPRHADLVPLADRVRYMQAFRLVVPALVLASWLLVPAVHAASPSTLAAVTGGYLLLSLAAETAWRAARRRGLFLVGAMLLVDGLYLAWLAYATGGASSPLRSLILIHVIVVALLASFRTGLKVTIWHSLLALMTFHARETGLLGGRGDNALTLASAEFRLLVLNVVVLWVVAIATACFAAINERELRRQRYDLQALASLAYALETALEPDAVAEALVDAVVGDFGFRRAALVVTPADGGPRLLAHHALDASVSPPAEPRPGSVLARVRGAREPLRVSRLDPDADAWLCRLLPRCRNAVVVPLHAEGRMIAVLVLEHGLRRGSRIERRVVAIVERFASHAALALDNAWLLEEVQRLATCDGLTGLPNRRQLEAAIGRELVRSQRTGKPFGFALIDIDRFKQVNDTHGHLTGDAVLCAVGRELTASARRVDVVARYGGEEFAVLLPEVDREGAALAAERLRRAVEILDGPVPVTVSVGVAVHPADGDDATALVEAADEALYESKRTGRNRAIVR